jgi:hypothetical protein
MGTSAVGTGIGGGQDRNMAGAFHIGGGQDRNMVGAFHWVGSKHRRAVQLEPGVGTEAMGTGVVEMGSWNRGSMASAVARAGVSINRWGTLLGQW